MDKSFIKAKPILVKLIEHGFDAYYVGGSVRDYLLNREIGDIDIATSALPNQVQALFEKVIPVGIDHGTVMVRYEGESYEVTTFRVEESYEDYRHPDRVHYVQKIEEDLARRDFTMNAVAMKLDGTIVDPFNGRGAIKEKRIETVGVAEERLQEDPLRMMRALRFVSQLGFSLAATTYDTIRHNAYLLERISIERKTVEMEKLIQGRFANRAWQLFIQSGVDQYLPSFEKEPSLIQKCAQLEWIPLEDMAEAITIFHQLATSLSVTQMVKDWKLSNDVKRQSLRLTEAVQQWGSEEDCYVLYGVGESLLSSFCKILQILNRDAPSFKNLKRTYEQLPIHSIKQLALNGNDVRALFPNRHPGPWMQQLLRTIEKEVVTCRIRNEKEYLKERALQWNQQEEDY
ncbi:CCA tRNA nucleotidyltransferase [Pontibacillus litoralis]|uniref:CCA-adding enzyme n=1 Tax=Pontibacillus litoralis JSM 072002 TaxID=1385512 RepID=A0A0A5G7A9_9BACI|nr:CCA tRNA nucleotidyltransferase [Pontibacillus litoralis]KGX87944.1 CCA-adding protein [Pontibacillus litoralis JSM 072002]